MEFYLVAGLFSCIYLNEINLVYAKNCFFLDVTDGQRKYYYCAPHEHCCGHGCCGNLMSFYRLWYFWICMLLLLMFCSGGTFWYKKRDIRQRVIMNHRPMNMNQTTILSLNTAENNANRWNMFTSHNPYVNNYNVPGPTPVEEGVTLNTAHNIVSYQPPPPYRIAVATAATNDVTAPPSYASVVARFTNQNATNQNTANQNAARQNNLPIAWSSASS